MNASEQEKNKKELLASCLDHLPGGVLICVEDPEGSILYVNKYVIEFMDCATEAEFRQLTGGVLTGMVRPEERRELFQVMKQFREGTSTFQHIRYAVKTRIGRLRYVDALDYLVVEASGRRLHYIFNVPGDDPVLNQDALPGVRKFFDYARQLPALMQQGGKNPNLAVVAFHVDHYKIYSLKYGAAATEKLISRCAAILQEVFSETFLFNLSEERFALLAPVKQLEEKIQQAHAKMREEYPDQVVMFHFGSYLPRMGGEDMYRSLLWAETACDNLREKPEEFYQEATAPVREKVQIRRYVVSHIDEAVEKDWIRPYYQPLVRAKTLELVGFEALARWQEPSWGTLLPDAFIGPLETSHQIDKLDQQMIRCVCREYRQRVDAGKPVYPVSLNLSRLDFFLINAFATLEKYVKEYRVPRNMLRVEITETLLVGQEGRMAEEVNRFREAGYQVWMDDFGSGYSSLHTLKSCNFDVMKLDKEFLRPFTERGKKILENVLEMTRLLCIRSLGEGVENREQLEFFRAQGCELVQGYLLGVPLPYEDSITACQKRLQQLRKAGLK